MLWQFSYGFSKFIVTRCSPDKLITFQAFYHINKISPQESKIIRSTSWFNSSFRTLAWKKIRQTHTHTHTQSFTHTLKTMSWALRLLGTRLLGTSNFRRHMAAFKREGNLFFKRWANQKTKEPLPIAWTSQQSARLSPLCFGVWFLPFL